MTGEAEVFGYPHTGLGDLWSAVSWMLRESVRTQRTIRAASRVYEKQVGPRIDEIVSVLDSPGRIETVDQDVTRWIHPDEASHTGEPYAPTKQRWRPGPHGRIAYQIDGHSHAQLKNPKPEDVPKLTAWCPSAEFVKLGAHLSLAACVAVAAASDLFFGVCSGLSHLCHSVGVPTFLIVYGVDPAKYHRNKPLTLCYGTDDFIAKAKAYLGSLP